MIAIMEGNNAVFTLLLETGANIELQNEVFNYTQLQSKVFKYTHNNDQGIPCVNIE